METKHRYGWWVIAASAAVLSPVAFAQAPDAGRLLQGIDGKPVPPATSPLPEVKKPTTDAPRPQGGPSVLVQGFKISGATVFPVAALQTFLDKYIGQTLDFDDLQSAADTLANHYRRHGYFLAHAYLPAQEIRDGQIAITILEGRVGEVRVEMAEDAIISPSVARGFIETHIKPGDLITDKTLERGLLLLNDLPGAEVKSTLVPGKTIGTADVVVTVGSGPRLTGQVEGDNFGQTTTGEWRYGGAANLNSPLGMGDQLSVRGLGTDDGGLSYWRLGYTLPVGPYGTRIGLAHTQMDYKLGGDFAALRAHGEAVVDNYYLLHPLYRTRNLNVFAQVGYDVKDLNDDIDSIPVKTEKSLKNYSATLFGDERDNVFGGGMSTWSLGYTWGDLFLKDKTADQAPGGHKTHGGFEKANLQLSRLQNILPGLALYASYTGQWASKNLDNAEKFSLGGSTGVRAYPQGEAPVDEGHLLTAELRYALGKMGTGLPGQFSVSAFADGGRGKTWAKPLATDTNNTLGRAGAGFGLTWGQPNDFLIRGIVAWRIGDPAAADKDRNPRVSVNAIKWF